MESKEIYIREKPRLNLPRSVANLLTELRTKA